MVGVTGSIPVVPTILRSPSERRMPRRSLWRRRAGGRALRMGDTYARHGRHPCHHPNPTTRQPSRPRRRRCAVRRLDSFRPGWATGGECQAFSITNGSSGTIRAAWSATPFATSSTMAGAPRLSCALLAPMAVSSRRPIRHSWQRSTLPSQPVLRLRTSTRHSISSVFPASPTRRRSRCCKRWPRRAVRS